MPSLLLMGGKLQIVPGGLTEPAAWIRVMAEVVIDSGSMSEIRPF